MSTINSKVIGDSMAKVLAKTATQLKPIYTAIAKDLLYDAVQKWEHNYSDPSNHESDTERSYVRDGVNMTGNTINSYMAGVYIKGKLADIVYAYDVGVTDKPTANYSYPGDVIYVWHQATSFWDGGSTRKAENSGKNLIREYSAKSGYKFQDVGSGSGIEDARKALSSMNPEGLLSLVVVVGVPYANYLESVRKLDVLGENAKRENVKHYAEANLSNVTIEI